MTATLDTAPDIETGDTHADGMPVIKKTATSSKPPVETKSTEQDAAGQVRPVKDWFSGWCTGGTKFGKGCSDNLRVNKVGEPTPNCRYIGENGEKVPNRFVYCACSCHDGNRVPEDPKFVEKR